MVKDKIKIFFYLLLFFVHFTAYGSAEKIVVERYENWSHPVLAVFKKYGISLHKVSYSPDGTCPTFYAKLKYCPDPRAPVSEIYYKKIYIAILKANSFFPYALVSEEDNLRINVGWRDKEHQKLFVQSDKAASFSLCKNGQGNPDDETFEISPMLKKQIMNSPLKASLRRKDGKMFVAYLYAENERIAPHTSTSCKTGEKLKGTIKTGDYYFYLYDVKADSFFSSRTKVLRTYSSIDMSSKRARPFVFRGNPKQSEILIISQSTGCSTRVYEAYGFWNDGTSLNQYSFKGKGHDAFQIFGKIYQKANNDKGITLFQSTVGEKEQFKLSISDTLGLLQLKDLAAVK
ncbi:MAG: hypothetical protein P4L79_11825 [Legionella sp.]|uniref:hypothetical protein n=1 Tax=Legionella sp. TaxID=459 RepID=UPI0028507B8C|nr:hypothetical protein [Legionella sp.]